MSGAQTERLFTVKELAATLRISPSLVYQYAGRGRIPHLRLGARVLFRPCDIEDWIAREVEEQRTKAEWRGGRRHA